MSRDPGADIWSALSPLVGPEGTAEQGGVRVRSGKKNEIEETRFFCGDAGQIKKGQVVHLLLHPRAEVFCKGNGAQAAA